MESQHWILVTGGAGYIGAHTVLELIRAGYKVVVVDNLIRSEPELLRRIEDYTGRTVPLIVVDIRDEGRLRTALKNFIQGKGVIKAVLHFAAFKEVGESTRYPLLYHSNNISGTISLLRVMQSLGIKQIIFSSSCVVYGTPETMPVTENTPFALPESPYATSKQACELILRDMAIHRGWKVISLRYFNPAGANEDLIIGEPIWREPQNLFPRIWLACRGYIPQLTVYGNDYPTPDGTPVRDYIHITDLAEAHVKALEYLNSLPDGSYHAFNLGSGRGYSVLEIIQTVEKIIGEKVPYKFGPRRPGDVPAVYSAYERAERELSWRPLKSLDVIISTAFAWFDKIAHEPYWQRFLEEIRSEYKRRGG